MFVPFLYALRARGVPVGAQEALALAQALARGLHESGLDGFYHLGRALLVHSEAHLDAFDEAFLATFKGVVADGRKLKDELLEWLAQAAAGVRPLTQDELDALERHDPDELWRLLEERMREQDERHDGGTYWIGTGGASPFGHSGQVGREGIRLGGPGGHRSALASADARRYRGYRKDLVLDVRQLGVALRKLRRFSREGEPDELDLEGTIDATAKNAGELEVKVRPPRRPSVRVLLLLDVGGSMDPYAHLVSRLFSAASKATHWKELKVYRFHNCVYGRLWKDDDLTDSVPVSQVLAEHGRHHKLIVVGDALMGPYELLQRGGPSRDELLTGLEWLERLAGHFDRAAWLNPEPPGLWRHNTIEAIARVFRMFPLTLGGLEEAMDHLVRGRGA